MSRIRTLIVAGGLAAVLTACSGSVSKDSLPATAAWPRPVVAGAPGDAVRRIAASSDATAAEQTARFTTSIDSTKGGEHVQVAAEGAVDLQNQNLSLHMDLAGALRHGDSGTGSTEVRIVDGVFYMDLGDLGDAASELGDGRRWLKLDLSGLTDMLGESTLPSESSNPVDGLDALRDVSSDVREIDTETVRGVETTHYRATIDLAKAPADAPPEALDSARRLLDSAGTPTIPVDVWLDAHNRVRKYTMQVEGASNASAGSAVAVTYELYDFGTPVDVTEPPADEVADLGSVFDGMLDGLLGGSNGITGA